MLYREVQRPRQWWLWGLIIFVSAIFWYIFIKQIFFGIQVGDNPAPDGMVIVIWFVFGVMPPLVATWFLKLIIEIHHDGIYIRFIPFHFRKRKFLFKDLNNFESIAYSIFDFGGLGIRINFDGEIAYNLNGKQAVKLKLVNKTVIIGTEKPVEFKKVLNSLIDTS